MRYNLPTILDNMIYDQRLPPMAAVMIDNGGAERSLEYDTVSSKYVEFVEAEVLPRAEREANVKLSKNPDARMTLGGSSGGRSRSQWPGSGLNFITASSPIPGLS